MTGPDVIAALEKQTDDMVGDLEALVEAESPSTDVASLRVCADVIESIGQRLIGAPELLEVGDRTHVRWRGRDPKVLVLGHFDTVWPLGTIARWGFDVSDGRATGPGIFDMKAGIIQGIYGLAQLSSLSGVEILFTGD
ncbi:MAG TPA: M20/M25/M40 family metallo-hydrolase, partial [Actinomycetota bacterium]|nr:M20/M25/M40 family metallo-hydrolase [Actinomycetota bacterium]